MTPSTASLSDPQQFNQFQEAVFAEQTWAEAGQMLARSRLSEKIIEAKERLLRESIAKNYAHIKGVERELGALQLQLKLTAGPKRSALELLRKKIELQTGRVVSARARLQEARKAVAEAEELLALENRAKDQLCEELNLIVQQSAGHTQLDKLEQLGQQLSELNNGMQNDARTSDRTFHSALRGRGEEALEADEDTESRAASTGNLLRPSREAAAVETAAVDSMRQGCDPARASTYCEYDDEGSSDWNETTVNCRIHLPAAGRRSLHAGVQLEAGRPDTASNCQTVSPTKAPQCPAEVPRSPARSAPATVFGLELAKAALEGSKQASSATTLPNRQHTGGSKRWAGPTYINSPPPSSLPKPTSALLNNAR
ncbi:hypothetical protein WJX72_009112 [[Myrmecia] bisecta]|uniref:Uncharacterized protein n=1 Tax=[Myrmecia] bisecta TaxID=41462 RepID=A0AAW1PWU3_9CHLO